MVNPVDSLPGSIPADLIGVTVIKVLTWVRNILTMLGTLTLVFLWIHPFSLTYSFEGSAGGLSQISPQPSVEKVTLHLNGSVNPRPTAVLIPLDETISSP